MAFKIIIIWFIVIISVCQSFIISKIKPVDVPAPQIEKSVLNENASFDAIWTKVENPDKDDPIIGYKFRILKLKHVKYVIYSITKGELAKREEESEQAFDSKGNLIGELTEILTPANVTTARTKPLDQGSTYEFRVLAYTKNGEGAESSPVTLKIHEE